MAKKWEVSYLLDFYGDVLTEKQRDVMVQYYNDDYSLAEIAENFGITRQGVRDAIKRGEATLLELEEKIGFAGGLRLNNAAAAHLALFRFGAFKMLRLPCERLFDLYAI